MRLALLRLLNRPSALQLLETLISSPVGLQQLSSASSRKCLHCQAHGLRSEDTAIASKALDGARGIRIRRVKNKVEGQDFIRLPLGPEQRRASDRDTSVSTGQGLHARQYPSRRSESTSIFPDTESGTPDKDELGAWTFDSETLELESDVTRNESVGKRLVDEPDRRQDFALWEELLRYRQRHYGDQGVIDIWKGLLLRKEDVELPTEGYYGDILWQSFVDVGLRRETFLYELYEYARDHWESSGKRWRNFYESIVGGYFAKGRPTKAIKWHKLLKDIHLSHPNEILHVFRQASSTRGGLAAFRDICRNTPGHKIYSSVVPTLYKRNRLQDTITMHKFLVGRDDATTKREDVHPLLDYVRQHWDKQENEEFHTQLRAADILKGSSHSPGKQVESETSTTEPPGETEETEHKHFQDGFGARLFATRALTFELILSGLRMFNVGDIGPLSLREMALRAENAKDVSNKIDQLQEAGISIGDSVFSRVVKKLARANDDRLLQDMLHNDQHPDVLEDWRIQESLLASYSLTGDWRQFDRTIAVLKTISEEDSGCFNLLFRNAINVGNRAGAVRLVEQMREHNVPLTYKSQQWMFEKLIKRRRRGQHPAKRVDSFDDISYLFGIWQYVVQTGGHVPPYAWREGLKRLGMTDRWDELEKLCLWLAHWYSPVSETSRTMGFKRPLSKPARNDGHVLHPSNQHSPLRAIFTPVFLEALVAWGFKMRVSPDHQGRPYLNPYSESGETLIPWMRGIILLRKLRDRGILVHRQLVSKACRQRLAVLYGEYRFSNRPINRILREENPWTLEEVLVDIRAAWGKPLFIMGEDWDRYRLVNPQHSPSRVKRYQEEDNELAERRLTRRFRSYYRS